MSPSPISATPQAASSNGSQNRSIGVTPDFHHISPTRAWALEAYMHLYLDSNARAESTLKSSIGRRAA